MATLPTPLVPALRLREAIGGPLVWVKRDDLTGFATAGNKARALEFLVGDARSQGRDVLVTGGGAGSNFCAAAAAAARVAGMDCHLVLYGIAPAQDDPARLVHPNLAAALDSGAQVHFTGRPDREEVDAAVPALAADLEAAGRRPYAMPRGGATAVGAAGYASAFDELARQLDATDPDTTDADAPPADANHPDAPPAAQPVAGPGIIVVATGSGGTQAGLVAGNAGSGKHAGRRWRILGATVSRPPAQVRATVTDLAQGCGSLLGRPIAGLDEVEVIDARGPGFGLASVEGEQARRIALDAEGLLLDPVYSAKAFAVVLALIAEGFRQPVVFWHTGGLPAALDHLSSEHLSSQRSALCPT